MSNNNKLPVWIFKTAIVSLLVSLCSLSIAQAPTAFGIPDGKQSNPAAQIEAVSGSRGQGWMAKVAQKSLLAMVWWQPVTH